MSKRSAALHQKFRLITGVVPVLLVLLLSAYVIVVDINTKYTWYYPLVRDRTIGEYYPKLEQRIQLYDLEKNETLTIVHRGLSLGGTKISSSTTSFAKVEYSGVNVYVLATVLALMLVQFYAFLRFTKSKSTLPLLLYIFLTVTSALTVISILHYINAGHETEYFVYASLHEEKLLGPIYIENTTLTEHINATLFTRIFKYAYVCQRELVRGTALVHLVIEDQLKHIVPSLPLIYIGDSVSQSYTKTSYVEGNYVWCSLFSMIEVNASYALYKLEFVRNPAVEALPLFLVTPLVLLAFSLGNVTMLSLMIRKQEK